MKKMSKLTKKLFLSAIALGLAVVTLTTTTFAWYTSSTTAQATNGSASTSGTTDDSSLMISTDGDTFGPSVSLDDTEVYLIPVQWKSNKFQNKNEQDIDLDNYYYEFTLYFKATSDVDVPVYISELKIKNGKDAIGDLTSYDNLVLSELSADTKNSDGLPNVEKYAVDVVSALDMVVSAGTKGEDASKFKTTSYELGGVNGVSPLSPSGFGTDETPNANAYYDKFMETNTVSDAADYNGELKELARTTVIGTIKAGEILQVTFKIYLNGWDNYCFDACRGQSFNVGLTFSSADHE